MPAVAGDRRIPRPMAFDFSAVASPFRMQPGLRRLPPATRQLTPCTPDSPALQEKLRVLSDQPLSALLCADGFDAGPALAALSAHATHEHPAHWRDDGVRAEAPALGWRLDADQPAGDGPPEIGRVLAALPAAWRRAALLALAFEEDFAVVEARGARIAWLAVCLPSHWAPADKVGLSFAEVHAPVADNTLLMAASEHLVRLVTGEDRWQRWVWTITPHAALDAHPARTGPRRWPQDLGRAWFRTEHQTFIPLPAHGQAVFTIHVERRPLADALADPQDLRRVHDALATMSDAVLAYRGLSEVRAPLLAWLRERSAPTA